VKQLIKKNTILIWTVLILFFFPGIIYARLQTSDPAPPFSLKNLQGSQIEINKLHGKQLLLLYFFDIESRSSLEGLNIINSFAQQYRSELTVFGISSSPSNLITQYVKKNNIDIQVLLETVNVRDLYHSRQILPVVFVIGPEFKIIEYYQGGGLALKTIITDTIKRQLQSRSHSSTHTTKNITKKLNLSVRKQPEQTTLPIPVGQNNNKLSITNNEGGQQGTLGKIISNEQWNQ